MHVIMSLKRPSQENHCSAHSVLKVLFVESLGKSGWYLHRGQGAFNITVRGCMTANVEPF